MLSSKKRGVTEVGGYGRLGLRPYEKLLADVNGRVHRLVPL
jgi:hypothetical protein